MDAIDRRMAMPLALAVGALVLIAVAQVATATHARPKGASPVRVSLVPAYKQCTTPNRMHGGALSYQSCNPPEQSSSFLTVGTLDANGAGANSSGFVRIKVKATSPEDVLISGTISDVRCKPATDVSVCTSANADGGPDYSGDLRGNVVARGTDHYNGPIGSNGGTDPATAQDWPDSLPFIFHCENTPDTSIGGLCTVDTTKPLIPVPYWFEGKRINLQITQVEVSDGGKDGDIFSEDNTLFEVQGLFVP